jgi:hypothetical protein
MRTAFLPMVLMASALFTAWTGFSSLTAPTEFGKQIGYSVAGMDGRNEVRAQYGGFFLAVTLASVLALTGVVPRQAGFLVNAVVFGGLIAGRLASLAIDGGLGGYGPVIRALFVIDTTGFTLSIIAFFMDRFPARSS